MKKIFTATLTAMFATALFAGDIGVMMKEKARGFGDSSAAQSTPPPPTAGTPSAPSTPPALPAPPPLTPQQQSIIRLMSDFASLKTATTEAPATQLATDLFATPASSAKPSFNAVKKLSTDLAAALTGKTISLPQRKRIIDDLQAVLGGANVSAAQLADIISDVPGCLKRAGADAQAAALVGEDLKAIAAEIKTKAGK